MPLYEYICSKCGHAFEKIESYSAPESRKCPKCGRKAKRQISSSAVQFKGAGWYVTEYGSKKAVAGDGAKTEQPASAESKTDSKKDSKDDSKPAATSESKAPASAAKSSSSSSSSGKKKE